MSVPYPALCLACAAQVVINLLLTLLIWIPGESLDTRCCGVTVLLLHVSRNQHGRCCLMLPPHHLLFDAAGAWQPIALPVLHAILYAGVCHAIWVLFKSPKA